MSADALAAVRDRIGGPLGDSLPHLARAGDRIGLRVLAAVHRLVLDGSMTPLIDVDAPLMAEAVESALLAHPDLLHDYLERVPQTNEIGRGRQLRRVLAGIDGPVRLVEVGSSAGLNLRPEIIEPDPGVSTRLPVIVERIGCDLDPRGVTDTSDVALLCSYVWMDDHVRLAALRGALDHASSIPVQIERESAAAYLSRLDLVPGTDTVVWHSALLAYLDATERDGIVSAVTALGAGASSDTRLVYATWERDGQCPDDVTADHVLTVRTWAGDGAPVEHALLRGSTHGVAAPATGAGA